MRSGGQTTTPGKDGSAERIPMKGVVEVLTRYLAKELGPRGIAANVVASGAMETDFTRSAFEHPGVKDFLAAQTALGRVGGASRYS